MTKVGLLTGSSFVAIASLIATQVAHATPAMAYAQAINNITGVAITSSPGPFGTSPLVNSNTALGKATATYGDYPPSVTAASGALNSATPTDPAEAKTGVGLFPGQNDFVPRAGFLLGMIGSRGDALMHGMGAGGVSVSDVAETRGDTIGTAEGLESGGVIFTVLPGTIETVTISFTDAIYLEALSADHQTATASIHNDFVIENALGDVVFEFAPTGTGAGSVYCGAVVCGTATSDPFNLQSTAQSINGFPGDVIITPSCITPGACFFSASSLPLAPGVYTISVLTQADAQISTPEPASLAVLGAGLLGLGFIRRRRAI